MTKKAAIKNALAEAELCVLHGTVPDLEAIAKKYLLEVKDFDFA